MCARKGAKSTVAPKFTSFQKKEQEKNARIKAKMEEDMDKRKPEMEAMAARAALIQKKADEKKEQIASIAADWTAQVMAVVAQVRHLRLTNPGVDGINAGLNAVGNTPGGNGEHKTNRAGDPLRLLLPKNDHNITKAEIFALMKGFDGSDSADLKIRIKDSAGNILVHIW